MIHRAYDSRVTRFGAFLGAICAAIVALISLKDPTFLGAEWLLQDAFTRRLASRSPLDPRVMIVSVNEKSVRTLDQAGFGKPPYSREVWAQAIRELQRAGARVIVVDIGLSEEDINHPEGDRAFAEAVRNAPVVLAADTDPKFPHDLRRVASDLWTIRGEPSPEIFGIVPPFMSNPPAIGTIRLENSPHTSVVHNYPLADRMTRDVYVPSLALEATRMYLRLPRNGEWQRGAFVFSGKRAPIDPNRNFLIRWHTTTTDQFVDFNKLMTAAAMREEPGADTTNLVSSRRNFATRSS